MFFLIPMAAAAVTTTIEVTFGIGATVAGMSALGAGITKAVIDHNKKRKEKERKKNGE